MQCDSFKRVETLVPIRTPFSTAWSSDGELTMSVGQSLISQMWCVPAQTCTLVLRSHACMLIHACWSLTVVALACTRVPEVHQQGCIMGDRARVSAVSQACVLIRSLSGCTACSHELSAQCAESACDPSKFLLTSNLVDQVLRSVSRPQLKACCCSARSQV